MEIVICVVSAASLLASVAILFKFFSIKRENDSLKDFILRQNSDLRKEISGITASYSKASADSVAQFSSLMQSQMKDIYSNVNEMTRLNSEQLEKMRKTIEENIKFLQSDNAEKLEKMRQTVDEKLNSTLEKRLTESFAAVSKQLESVYKGLGEMQTLASSVGDLRNALTNVKVRGTWGEVSLDNLLSQLLTQDQYKRNVKPNPRSQNIVEFCICLPNNNDDSILYLPIDCKFPIEQYIRLCDASQAGDTAGADAASKELEAAIKLSAKTIRDKYITPPYTTDFAIMYLPIEGLYAEVVRRSGLCEMLQRQYRVTIAGPTTLGAFLNSLQLGFKTLAIQKQTSQITQLLLRIRDNFAKFTTLLGKVKKKLDEAGSTFDDATKKYDSIGKLLNKADKYIPSETSFSDEIENLSVEISNSEN